jgi:hypothetical protein
MQYLLFWDASSSSDACGTCRHRPDRKPNKEDILYY